MSSSTSSSNPFLGWLSLEWPMVAVVAGMLLALELVFRLAGPALSNEQAQILGLPEQARTLEAASGERVLLVGNSLLIDGVQVDLLKAKMADVSPGVVLDSVAFHGSETAEWYWILRHYFWTGGKKIDRLVLVVNDRMVSDTMSRRIRRLASISRGADITAVVEEELSGLEEIGSFLHAWLFESFAGRKRMQLVVLERFLPHYKAMETEVNRRLAANPRSKPSRSSESHFPCERFSRLLAAAARMEIPTAVVFMPAREPYEIPPSVLEAMAEYHATLMDCREVPGMGADDFADDVHLTGQGAKILTLSLATQLQSWL